MNTRRKKKKGNLKVYDKSKSGRKIGKENRSNVCIEKDEDKEM